MASLIQTDPLYLKKSPLAGVVKVTSVRSSIVALSVIVGVVVSPELLAKEIPVPATREAT